MTDKYRRPLAGRHPCLATRSADRGSSAPKEKDRARQRRIGGLLSRSQHRRACGPPLRFRKRYSRQIRYSVSTSKSMKPKSTSECV